MRVSVLAALMLVCIASTAEARPRAVHQVVCDNVDTMRPCGPAFPSATAGVSRAAASGSSQVIGGRPTGCPSAYCGCGASLHLFGRIIPSLNLAANWFRFPRAAPAPRMAAVRRHHVFVLEQYVSGDVWIVFDSNSGAGRTRMHARSIAGYQIVNPSGAS